MYQERYVAFIDILGFKEIVDRTYKSEKEFNRLKDVIEYIEFLRERNYESPLGAELSKSEFSLFSDSIIFSYPDGNVLPILFDISSLCVKLIDRGYIFRGGITFGPLVHNGQICYGPAMNRAVVLEKQAEYPRVVVEPIVIQQGVKYPVVTGNSAKEKEGIKKRYLRIEEGVMFLDFLGNEKGAMGEQEYFCFMKNIREFLLSEFTKIIKKMQFYSNDKENLERLERVRRKYSWFFKYYNSTVEKCLGKQELLINDINLALN